MKLLIIFMLAIVYVAADESRPRPRHPICYVEPVDYWCTPARPHWAYNLGENKCEHHERCPATAHYFDSKKQCEEACLR